MQKEFLKVTAPPPLPHKPLGMPVPQHKVKSGKQDHKELYTFKVPKLPVPIDTVHTGKYPEHEQRLPPPPRQLFPDSLKVGTPPHIKIHKDIPRRHKGYKEDKKQHSQRFHIGKRPHCRKPPRSRCPARREGQNQERRKLHRYKILKGPFPHPKS